jgi:predicted nucleic acid-binding protein
MANSPKRVCWDACSWIALIKKEKILKPDGSLSEDRYALCRSVIDAADNGRVEITISGLCLVEVCKEKTVVDSTEDKIAKFFENSYILLVPVDTQVGTQARWLMLAGYDGLKPPDATHLATAVVANADELHTFDKKLLDLDGKLTKLDGTLLKICKPGLGGPPLPLMEHAAKNDDEATP